MTNKQRDILCSAVFLVFGTAMFYFSLGIAHKIESDVGSAYVPKFIAICILIVSSAKLLLTLRDHSASGKKKDAAQNDWLGGLGTIGLMMAYMLALQPVGFILSSIAYLFAQIMLMSNRENRKPVLFAVISISLPIAVYGLFNYVIKMPLPRGILGF